MKALLYGCGKETFEVTRYWEGEGHRQTRRFDGLSIRFRRDLTRRTTSITRTSSRRCLVPSVRASGSTSLSLAVTVGGIGIDDFCRMSISKALEFVNNLKLSETEMVIAKEIIKEVKSRLGFLESVDLTTSRSHAKPVRCQVVRLSAYGSRRRSARR